MIKNKGGVISLIGFIGISLLWTHTYRTASPPARLEVVPMEVAGGWGYSIMLDGKAIIIQDVIPAISGRHAFTREKDALAVGNWVCTQIAGGKSPSVSPEIVTHLLENP